MNRISLIVLLVTVFVCTSSQAILPVTDPTSYGYYIQQINKTAELLDATQKQIDTLGGIRTAVDQQKLALQGTYNMTMGAIDHLKRSAETLSKTTPPIKETLDINNTSGAYVSGGNYEQQIDDYLKSFYIDPRSVDPKTGKRPDPSKLAAIRLRDRMKAVKNTIVLTESIMKEQDERIKTMNELAKRLNQTTTLKESQDLGNRILLEILMLMHDQLSVFLQSSEATALANFRYTPEDVKNEVNTTSGADTSSNGGKKGVLDGSRASQDVDQIFNQ